MGHRQAGPVEGLFGEPVLTLLPGFAGADQCHLGDRQLGHVDEDLEMPVVQGGCCRGHGRLQIGGGDAQSEVHPATAVERPGDVGRARQIAHGDVRPQVAELGGTLVVPVHECANRQTVAA